MVSLRIIVLAPLSLLFIEVECEGGDLAWHVVVLAFIFHFLVYSPTAFISSCSFSSQNSNDGPIDRMATLSANSDQVISYVKSGSMSYYASQRSGARTDPCGRSSEKTT